MKKTTNKNANTKKKTYKQKDNNEMKGPMAPLVYNLEQGLKPWEQMTPAYNVTTGHVYEGINAVLLPPGKYCTFLQAKNVLKGKIKKGAKAAGQVWYFMQPEAKEEEAEEVNELKQEEKSKKKGWVKPAYVFHLEDVEGYDPEKVKEPKGIKDPRPKRGTFTMEDIRKEAGQLAPELSLHYLAVLIVAQALNCSNDDLDPYTAKEWADTLRNHPNDFGKLRKQVGSLMKKIVDVKQGAVKVESTAKVEQIGEVPALETTHQMTLDELKPKEDSHQHVILDVERPVTREFINQRFSTVQ